MLFQLLDKFVDLIDPYEAAISAGRQTCLLPVRDGVPEARDADEVEAEAARDWIEGRRDRLVARLKDQLASNRQLWSTWHAYDYTLRGFNAALFRGAHDEYGDMDPRAGERAIAALTAYRRKRGDDPLLLTLEARTFQIVGQEWRGGGWAHQVTAEGWEEMERCFDHAHGLLLQVPAEERGVLWHRFRFVGAIADCRTDGDGLAALFEPAWQAAPEDLALLFARAYSLLPRWYGDYAIFDDFAREAARRTSAKRGMSLYPEIYISVADAEDIARDMCCDWELMKRGFEDRYERNPNSASAVEALRCAWQFEDWDYARGLIESGKVNEWRPAALDLRDSHALWAYLFLGKKPRPFIPALERGCG
ncbi:MAG: hypothetical protein AAF577_12140 [Pseudomonadota bacterium]